MSVLTYRNIDTTAVVSSQDGPFSLVSVIEASLMNYTHEICVFVINFVMTNFYWASYLYLLYEGWNFNSGNYLFTTDTK